MSHAAKRTAAKSASTELLYILAGFVLGLAAVSGLTFSLLPERPDATPVGGSFSLIAQDGRLVTSDDLKGHPYLVFFGYTHCPDLCPTALSDISAVFKELGPDKKIAALFITVDPQRDTPEVLKAYLENFDSRIIGLTGSEEQAQAVAKAFRVFILKAAAGETGDYTVDHSGATYLMDKRGRFVRTFDLSRPPGEAARELERYL